jgi:hypothetical protein
MALTSGKYVARTEREVVIWPPADADGDGPVVWLDRYDSQGRNIGRDKAKDANGNEIHEYLPPDGFKNLQGYDRSTDNYVLIDERGDVYRQPNGEAVNIKPGQAIVFNPDGSTEVLPDEYAQYLFEKAHDAVEGDAVEGDAVEDDAETVVPVQKTASRKKAKV